MPVKKRIVFLERMVVTSARVDAISKANPDLPLRGTFKSEWQAVLAMGKHEFARALQAVMANAQRAKVRCRTN